MFTKTVSKFLRNFKNVFRIISDLSDPANWNFIFK